MYKNKQNISKDNARKCKGRLPEDVVQYYRRVSTELGQEFEDDEDNEVLLKNVFTQLCSDGIEVAQNQTVSSIIETLLKKATDSNLSNFFNSMKSDFETACCDRFASHVTQTLLLCCHRCLNNRSTKDEERSVVQKQVDASIFELYEFIKTNLIAYVEHTYACHIICTLVEIFGCVSVSDFVISRKSFKDDKEKSEGTKVYITKYDNVDNDNLRHIKKLSKALLKHPHFVGFLTNSCASLVVQTLMLVTKQRLPDVCENICSMVVKHAFSKDSDLISHPSGSHVVEQLFHVCSDEVFNQMFQQILDGDLLKWAIHPSGNFVIQKWLQNLRTVEQDTFANWSRQSKRCLQKEFEAVFDKLSVKIEEILANNCCGLVVSLAKGAAKHNSRQQKLIEALMAAFHCASPPERQSKLVPLIAAFTTYESFYKIPEEGKEGNSSESEDDEAKIELPTLKMVNYHGSVLLQNLFQFTNPRAIISGILDLSKAELSFLICHNVGSHVIDAFLGCGAVGEKSRELLHKKMKGSYTNIACDKHGSRIIEKIWMHATLKQRILIAEELNKYQARVRGDRFGMFIYRKSQLDLFNKHRAGWEKQQQAGQTRHRAAHESKQRKPEKRPAGDVVEHKKKKKRKRGGKRKGGEASKA